MWGYHYICLFTHCESPCFECMCRMAFVISWRKLETFRWYRQTCCNEKHSSS
jgi:hypothetical protein